MPKLLCCNLLIGVLAGLGAYALAHYDPVGWTQLLPAPYADLVLEPKALLGQVVGVGVLVCLLVELLACTYVLIRSRALAEGLETEAEFNPAHWYQRQQASLLGRWRWYLILAVVPALSALWFSLGNYATLTASGYWEAHWAVLIGTAQGVLLLCFGMMILWWGCRGLSNVKEAKLALLNAAPPTPIATPSDSSKQAVQPPRSSSAEMDWSVEPSTPSQPRQADDPFEG